MPIALGADAKKVVKKKPLSLLLPIINVSRINTPPFLDGLAIDKCWQKTTETEIPYKSHNATGKITLKACTDREKIYFLVSYQTKLKNTRHQSWKWDPVIQAYIPSGDKEESLSIIIKEEIRNKEADVWIWRAGRTDPVNKADDLYYIENKRDRLSANKITMDNGQKSWFSKYFGEYAGTHLPRFYNKKPSGSVADVNAKGSWDKQQLNIEFSRRFETDNSDDINFKKGTFYIQIYRGVPTAETINENPFSPLIIK